MNAIDFTILIGHQINDSALDVFLAQFGKKPDLDDDGSVTAYLEYKRHGFCVLFKERRFTEENIPEKREDQLELTTIMFFTNGYENYKAFQGDLPFGIRFSDSRDEARNKAGIPASSGGGNKNSFQGGLWPEWDRYQQDVYTISFEYNDDKSAVNIVRIRKD